MIFDKQDRMRPAIVLAILGLFLLCALGLGLVAGEYRLTAAQAFDVLFLKLFGTTLLTDAPLPKMHEVIVWNIRAPRLLVAALSGVALASAGSAYQGCFRNPLVEPFILGVSSGAAFGAALAIVLPHIFPSTQLTAFVFGLSAVALACGVARRKGHTPPMALVLSGIVIGSLFTALLGIMKYAASDAQLRDITFWMMGGFYYSTWRDAAILAVVVLPCFAGLFLFGWRLNLLSLGDDEAKSLGINPSASRMAIIFLATLAAATCVATAGIIAWVGLMMPHAARLMLGPDNRLGLPAAALMGAAYLLVCDTLARTLTGAEIPIAIVASLLGGPYLLWLLRSRGRDVYE